MTKYLYTLISDSDSYPSIKSIMARDLNDAETRIMRKYSDKFEDMDESDNFRDFTDDLYEKHNININPNIYDIEII